MGQFQNGCIRIGGTFNRLCRQWSRRSAAHMNFPLDKRCEALTQIIAALYQLDCDDPAPYLQGLRHYQPEAANGGEAGVLLLMFKVLSGDSEPEVLGECFVGLLAASPDRMVGFVGEYMHSKDPAIAEAAILALGESRLSPAFAILREKWRGTVNSQTRRILLAAMAASRLEEAIIFLVSIVSDAAAPTAVAALEVLSTYRSNERVRTKLRDAVAQRDEKAISAAFNLHFSD